MTEKIICNLCPRRCSAERTLSAGNGVCGMGLNPVCARAALHEWEEPCVSGDRGSGAVFFSGCTLKCAFCQNVSISHEKFGKEITSSWLREIFFELIGKGAHNINLVNPTHFTDAILEALDGGLPVPLVYNSSGYELVETLSRYEGKVDVYLPDLKYADDALAMRYSRAPDYFETAKSAIREMFRQTGPYEIDDDGIIRRGVIVRHLILPGNLENTRRVIEWISEEFLPGDILFSLMSQFTPCGDLTNFPELQRRITLEEYDEAQKYLDDYMIYDGFYQELSSAKEEYIPPFDLEGI